MNPFDGHEDAGQRIDDPEHRVRMKALENRIRNLLELVHRLDRIEQGGAPVCAHDYQVLVRNVMRALAQELPGATLRAVLNTHPAAAQIHENMHYATAGLSRAPYARGLVSQMVAAGCLARLAMQAPVRVRKP